MNIFVFLSKLTLRTENQTNAGYATIGHLLKYETTGVLQDVQKQVRSVCEVGSGGRTTAVIEWISQILGNQRTMNFVVTDVTLFPGSAVSGSKNCPAQPLFTYATSRSSDLDLKTLLVSLIQITMFLFVEFIEIIGKFYRGINYWLSLKFNRGAVLSMIQVNSKSTQLLWFTRKNKIVLYGLITTGSFIWFHYLTVIVLLCWNNSTCTQFCCENFTFLLNIM